MVADVYFLDLSKARTKPLPAEIMDLFDVSNMKQLIALGSRVAVKIHFGERGNVRHVRPIFVRTIVDKIKEAGGEPVVTETTQLYPESKKFEAAGWVQTAAMNGFTPETVGAPIVIADGENGDDGLTVTVGGKIGRVEVAKFVADAEAMILVVHAKGHNMCGFGGAIKGLGMGCTTKKGKAAQHRANIPLYNSEKCDGCGTCVRLCRFNAAAIEEGKAVFNREMCTGCLCCFFSCSKKALEIPPNAKIQLQRRVAEAASGVLKTFEKGKVGYFSFIMDVTPRCDCDPNPGNPIIPDLGVLASFDPVAIDSAALNMINKAPWIPRIAEQSSDDKLGLINNVDSRVQLRAAEDLGIGSATYNLIEI